MTVGWISNAREKAHPDYMRAVRSIIPSRDPIQVAAGRPEDYPEDKYEMWELCTAGVPYLPAWRRDR